MAPSTPITVGLASFGMSGKVFHAPFLEKSTAYNLKYVLERSKKIAQSTYPNITSVENLEQLLAQPDLELVIINVPTYLHFQWAKEALMAGKHVVVEKPFAVTSQEAKELIHLSLERELTLSVYQNRRLDGGFKTVQTILQDNLLGSIESCKIAMHRIKTEIGPKKWKEEPYPGAGILYDLGAHLIDQALTLFGYPTDLEADLQIQRKQGEVIDYFKLTLHYPTHTAILMSDMLTPEDKYPMYELKGKNGTFIKYGKDPQEQALINGNTNWQKIGKDEPNLYGQLTVNNQTRTIPTQDGSYYQFYDLLANTIQDQQPLFVKPTEALAVLQIIEWALDIATVKKRHP